MPKSTNQITEPRLPVLNISDLDPIEADDLSRGEHVDYVQLAGTSLAARELDGVIVQESEWRDVDLSDTRLEDARFADCRLTEVFAGSFHGRKLELRNCQIARSRLGFVDLTEANLNRVRFEDSKFGYLSLRGAKITDAVFERCTIEEIDLTDATVERAAFPGSRLDSMTLAVASVSDLDLRTADVGSLKNFRSLRGVTIDGRQLIQFAELFAQHLGLRVA